MDNREREYLDRLINDKSADPRERFGAFFQRYCANLLKIAHNRMTNVLRKTMYDTDDLVSETLLKLLHEPATSKSIIEACGNNDPKETLAQFFSLFHVKLMNVVQDIYKKAKAQKNDGLDNVPINNTDIIIDKRTGNREVTPFQNAIANETTQRINSLPEELAKILFLIIEGRKVPEIAQENGLSQSDTYNKFYKARNMFQHAIEGKEGNFRGS